MVERATSKRNRCREQSMRRTALTIAGSDCSGGAGIQADIKTMLANGVYAMSAVTALTAQNTTGVTQILEVTPQFLEEQLDQIFTDIYPDAVKIGMVSSAELVRSIAAKLQQYPSEHIVIDPVMSSTSGTDLLQNNTAKILAETLFPLAQIITPNIPEAQILSGQAITSASDMEEAAGWIGRTYGCAVLLKGGHCSGDANDLFYQNGTYTWFPGKRIDNPNTHGTGCTLSSAIAANLAKGYELSDSIARAKSYLTGALEAQLNLGKGSGPLDHGYNIETH